MQLNSLFPGRCGSDFEIINSLNNSKIDILSIQVSIHLDECHMISLNVRQKLVPAMAWSLQARSHYRKPCWLISPKPHGPTRPRWVKRIFFLSYFKYSAVHRQFKTGKKPFEAFIQQVVLLWYDLKLKTNSSNKTIRMTNDFLILSKTIRHFSNCLYS